jgi:hypothetical protein
MHISRQEASKIVFCIPACMVRFLLSHTLCNKTANINTCTHYNTVTQMNMYTYSHTHKNTYSRTHVLSFCFLMPKHFHVLTHFLPRNLCTTYSYAQVVSHKTLLKKNSCSDFNSVWWKYCTMLGCCFDNVNCLSCFCLQGFICNLFLKRKRTFFIRMVRNTSLILLFVSEKTPKHSHVFIQTSRVFDTF